MANAKGKTQAKPATVHEAAGGGERDFDGSSAEEISATLFRASQRLFARRTETPEGDRRRSNAFRRLPVRQAHEAQAVRKGAARAPDRTRQTAKAQSQERRPYPLPLRRPRRLRQGVVHQSLQRAHEPAQHAHRRPPKANRDRTRPALFSALCRASADGRRNRPLRPLLVQSRWCRTRHGLLHKGPAGGVFAGGAGVRRTARPRRHQALQVLSADRSRDAVEALLTSGARTRSSNGSYRTSIWRR